jgi:hypothetical protein
MDLLCRETLPDGECLRPATHICGRGVGESLRSGYPTCDRCAQFWSDEYQHEVTGDEPDLAAFILAWQSVPTVPRSRLVRLTPAHRRAMGGEAA